MPTEKISIQTRDGSCPAWVMTPADTGPWPAVIFYGDAGGIRPAMQQMAQKLTDGGFLVLLPDLYYRHGPYAPLVPAEVFKGDVMAILGPLMATTGTDKAAEDTAAFLDYLGTRGDVAGGKLGAVGFCMGGGLAIASAAGHSERFAAVVSFHGGNLATDAPTSPHLRVKSLAAEVYIASADKDASYPPEMAARFEHALAQAGVHHRVEKYDGALHGWMVPDFPVFNAAAADRGWQAMLALFRRTLRA